MSLNLGRAEGSASQHLCLFVKFLYQKEKKKERERNKEKRKKGKESFTFKRDTSACFSSDKYSGMAGRTPDFMALGSSPIWVPR